MSSNSILKIKKLCFPKLRIAKIIISEMNKFHCSNFQLIIANKSFKQLAILITSNKIKSIMKIWLIINMKSKKKMMMKL